MIITSKSDGLAPVVRPGRLTRATATLAGALLLLGAVQAHATTIPYKNFNDLLRESDAVVSGRVSKVESKYSANKEDIFTFVTLDQVQTLSGSYSAPTVTLRFLGGQVGNDVLQVSGSPNFAANQQVIVFVQGNGRSMVPVVGWSQGVFRVGRDSATGQQVVRDNEGNRVGGVQNGMLIKETTNQPEAQIIGPQGVELGTTKSGELNAGSADFLAPAAPLERGAAVAAPDRPVAIQSAMTVTAFVSAIKSAPVSRAAAAVLRSVEPNDADTLSDNSDGSVGGRTAAVSSGQPQAPALPTPAPAESPAQDQR